jgi:ADP-ribose pyrophosphatase
MDQKFSGADMADGRSSASISEQEVLAKGFRPLERFRFTAAGQEGPPQTRDILRAGHCAAVLPLDLNRGEVVVLRQFRLAAHLANGSGNLVEIVAGHVEPKERVIETARRECREEIGLTPNPLIELFSYFTSPGTSDEVVTLFVGIVDASFLPQRAGAARESEATRPMRVSIDAALAALAGGNIHNGLLITSLQWLALNRANLREIVRGGASS